MAARALGITLVEPMGTVAVAAIVPAAALPTHDSPMLEGCFSQTSSDIGCVNVPTQTLTPNGDVPMGTPGATQFTRATCSTFTMGSAGVRDATEPGEPQ